MVRQTDRHTEKWRVRERGVKEADIFTTGKTALA